MQLAKEDRKKDLEDAHRVETRELEDELRRDEEKIIASAMEKAEERLLQEKESAREKLSNLIADCDADDGIRDHILKEFDSQMADFQEALSEEKLRQRDLLAVRLEERALNRNGREPTPDEVNAEADEDMQEMEAALAAIARLKLRRAQQRVNALLQGKEGVDEDDKERIMRAYNDASARIEGHLLSEKEKQEALLQKRLSLARATRKQEQQVSSSAIKRTCASSLRVFSFFFLHTDAPRERKSSSRAY